MSSYNIHLLNLRHEKGLSIKEASKEIGISPINLFFYENGYFRPGKKARKKLEAYYQEDINIKGLDAYPTPVPHKERRFNKDESLTRNRILFASLTIAMLACSIAGGVIFNRSVNNVDSFYGDTYNELREKVKEDGTIGHDLVTSLPFYEIETHTSSEQGTINFYQTDNILYFNECSYSATFVDIKMGIGRYHFQFGNNLGVASNVCEFTYGSLTYGSYFSCQFEYNLDHVEDVDNFKVVVKGNQEINKEMAISFINNKLGAIENFFSTMMSEELGRSVSFYNDFLPAREQGRAINFKLQIAGLFLMIPGIFLFFVFGGIFLRLMVTNIKPRLVNTSAKDKEGEKKPLPEDFNIKFGIPDYITVFISRLLTVGSVTLMLIGLLAKLGLFSLHPFFATEGWLSFLQIALLSGIFLGHFISLGRLKRPEVLLKKIIYFLFLFLFIATIETVIISITNAWGYDFASLIYQFLPGNVFQILAVQLIIYLFLFFQPPFLNEKPKWLRYLWHGLALIPTAFLIVTYFVSNSYALTYGVKENVYINFWFPNGFLTLSMVSTLFMFTMFFINLLLEKKYGQRNAQLYSYGDRFTVIENSVCAGLILLVGLFDLLFIHNQVGYYLGLGYNQWIFTLIPIILLVKYSPNRKQTLLLDEEMNKVKRD